ncbi:hypothetical protein RLEG12_04875 (plasmid) [Rhizobium leguminosarum bv. trifolii CB782]|uniref:Uncharacterized protein n=1 Tax=Rhizobium hidalgonense TaxID=1538159 RepID=A0A2A6KJG6_9HYPH|nr:hypothetical protein [Rhizobium hidalgonense]AHG48248.1 hypothetical protein RLEG12_04875 [Rhizobium leguminosarum bv. trifolii CB782]MDR9772159.1 hypothetical protein [Rhizobium hidalgonense]MDR9810218.1 hypothetical protein [Rhizobium hidalgonense]MDR9817773.1 hypothetical protein [Rhizobium hidalgonense]PDT24924.1 hypothetical protein CO674_02565 [Rhizobium hidalgonense]
MARSQEATIPDAERPAAGEQLWSVFEFARRYRLAKREENRLLMLYGPTASLHDLLANAQRHSLLS